MQLRQLQGALAAVVLAGGVAACGSSSSSSTTSKTASTPTVPKVGARTETGGVAPQAGKGKPAVVLGDENFTEEYVLGALYQQALQARGYTVSLKSNIGSAELIWKAFQSGQIGVFPEYTGTLLTAIEGITAPPHSAAAAYDEAKAWLAGKGATLLPPTPFYDSDAIGTTTKYAATHHLKTIADLAPLGKKVRLGGLPEFRTRGQALVGLRKAYKINPTFVPLASGLFYSALDSGQVDVSDVFTTDPPLKSGKYVVLTDPKHVFGFQNVEPVVKTSVLKAEGPAFAQTLNKVDALLTTPAVIAMNAAVILDKQPPSVVAHAFLKANGLVP